MSQYNNKQRAAALRYAADDPGRAPIVVASGMGYTAQKIIDLAQESNIPVYQDDALASLLAQLDAGSEIPPELYQAVADIYLYFLNYGSEKAKPTFPPLIAGAAKSSLLPEFVEEASEKTEDE